MAAVRFPCPQCGQMIKAPPGQGGQRFQCPRCDASITAPGDDPQKAAPAAPTQDDLDSLFWDSPGPTPAQPEMPQPPPKPPERQRPASRRPEEQAPERQRPGGSQSETPIPKPAPPNKADAPKPSQTLPAQGGSKGSIPRPLPAAPGRPIGEVRDKSPPKPTKQRPSTRKPKKDYFRISCRLCGTRIDVEPKQIGSRVKCPDCHSLNEVVDPAKPAQMPKPPQPDSLEEELQLAPPPEVKVTPVTDEVLATVGPTLDEDEIAMISVDDTDVVDEDHEHVEKPSLEDAVDDAQPGKKQRSRPDFGFHCKHCGTWLRAEREGQTIRCPDCLSDCIAPAPPPESRRITDAERFAADDDDEFRLEEVSDRPLYQPLARGDLSLEDIHRVSTPEAPPQQVLTTFHFYCPSCQDPLVVTPRQVGVQHNCPKCQTTSIITAPETESTSGQPASSAPPAASRAAETTPKRSSTPKQTRPPSETPARPPIVKDQEKTSHNAGPPSLPGSAGPAAALVGAAAAAASPGRESKPATPPPAEKANPTPSERRAVSPQKKRKEDRPLLDEPYASVMFRFFASPAALLSLAAVTLGLGVLLGLGLLISYCATHEQTAYRLGAFVFAVAWIASFPIVMIVTASNAYAIVKDTANGAMKIEDWLEFSDFFDNIPFAVMMGTAGCLSMAPGGALASMLSAIGIPGIVLAFLFVLPSMFLLYPYLLLSLMENDSMFIPISKEVYEGARRSPGAWLQFYGEAFVLTVALVAVCFLPSQFFPVVAAVFALLIFLYHRALGRLAYRCAVAEAEA